MFIEPSEDLLENDLNGSENPAPKTKQNGASKTNIAITDNNKIDKKDNPTETEKVAKKYSETDILMVKAPAIEGKKDEEKETERTLQLANLAVIVNNHITTPVA